MDKKRKQIIAGNEISQLYTFSLGGVPQKVLVEGKRRDLPVVISLHGGPGTPVPFSAGCRGLFPQFTDRFIMVYWDQLGCGINNCRLKDKYGIDSFVAMTADLIAEIRKLFPENRIILLGMSWGSVLALRCAEKADAVVVWGQVLHSLMFNDIVYTALEKAGLSAKKMKRIRAATPDNFTNRDMMFISGSVRKHTDGYYNKNGKRVDLKPIIKGLLSSPDYRFRDFKAIMVNGTTANARLWSELLKIDLREALAGVQVPYYILQGETDIVTPTAFVADVVGRAENPMLSLSIKENNGHIPGEDGMQAVLETLLRAAGKE